MNLIKSDIKTMSSSQLAELLGYEKKEVNKKINSMFLSEIAGEKISRTTRENGQVIEYYLPEVEAQMFAAKWNIQHLRKVVEFFVSAPSQPQIPQNFADALRLAADQAEQLAIAAPKVAFVEKYVESTGNKGFREVAKLLNVREPRFRSFLQSNRIMYQLAGNWTAYQNHIDAGRFHVSTGTKNEHAYNTVKFTPKGVAWISELIEGVE